MDKVAIVKDGKVLAIVNDVFSKSVTSCHYGFENSIDRLHAANPKSLVNARPAKLSRAKKLLSVKEVEYIGILLNIDVKDKNPLGGPKFLLA